MEHMEHIERRPDDLVEGCSRAMSSALGRWKTFTCYRHHYHALLELSCSACPQHGQNSPVFKLPGQGSGGQGRPAQQHTVSEILCHVCRRLPSIFQNENERGFLRALQGAAASRSAIILVITAPSSRQHDGRIAIADLTPRDEKQLRYGAEEAWRLDYSGPGGSAGRKKPVTMLLDKVLSWKEAKVDHSIKSAA
jgi:hypothetical protein